MSTVEITLPGRNQWKKVEVICGDAQGIYVGVAGQLGPMGSVVLLRYRRNGQEVHAVARQKHIYGRYEFLQGAAA